MATAPFPCGVHAFRYGERTASGNDDGLNGATCHDGPFCATTKAKVQNEKRRERMIMVVQDEEQRVKLPPLLDQFAEMRWRRCAPPRALFFRQPATSFQFRVDSYLQRAFQTHVFGFCVSTFYRQTCISSTGLRTIFF